MEIISLLRFLILLSVLIFVHEGGHFLFAKKFRVKVEEFGFGLPPRLWGKKIKDTIYSLNLLPLGGFVRLKGEEQAEALGLGQVGSFAIQSKWKRAVIIAAGAFGSTTTPRAEIATQNGTVQIDDIVAFASAFGATC